MPEIVLASSHNDLETTKALFIEYQQELNVDLCFQEFENELDTLPGEYAQPDGRIFLLKTDNKAVGCIALKPVGNNHCEMKRLYIRREFRDQHFGRLLINKLITEARDIGYSKMLLDTLPHLVSAISLYKKLGFVDSAPTYQHEGLDLIFLSLNLS